MTKQSIRCRGKHCVITKSNVLRKKMQIRFLSTCEQESKNKKGVMDECCVHHVEFGVRNGEDCVRRFTHQYKFSLAATRVTEHLKQWVMRSGSANVLITQQLSSSFDDQYCVGWTEHKHFIDQQITSPVLDSVFNVALKVKNLKHLVERLSRSGVTILRSDSNFSDKHGEISLAIVKSCLGNVVHTLIDDSKYTGSFLPDFIANGDCLNSASEKLVSHFDHVTFACECGESTHVLDWYSRHFGMRRFFINRDESESSGFVIDSEDIGLRLKAFEYWKCAETGLASGSHPESIKFVVAEALPNQGPNQVDTFLHDHGCSGIQHIGLHTDDIIDTVGKLKENGVDFAEPPYTYYTEVGKLEEICDIGQDVDILRQNGILVDAEADIGESIGQSSSHAQSRYLMQKFTKPLFDRNTFFLEVIQRVGARGFGSGNITALWRSVQAYLMNKGKQS